MKDQYSEAVLLKQQTCHMWIVENSVVTLMLFEINLN